MTQFDEQVRVAAIAARDEAQAEMESARRMLATIDGTVYFPLEKQIADLQDEADELVRTRKNALLDLDAANRQRIINEATISRLNTDLANFQERIRHLCATHNRTVDELRGSLRDRIDQIDKLHRKDERRKKEIDRLKRELDVAQGAPVPNSGREFGDKAQQGGEQKSGTQVQFSADARAVRDWIATNVPTTHGVTFTAREVSDSLATLGRKLSIPRVNKALRELEGIFVVAAGRERPKSAMRWTRRKPIRAARRKGIRAASPRRRT